MVVNLQSSDTSSSDVLGPALIISLADHAIVILFFYPLRRYMSPELRLSNDILT